MKISKFSEMLQEHFNRDEIIELFTKLALDFEDAPSLSKKYALIPELIKSCRENGKLGDLLQICNQERDFADWPTLAELTVTENDDLLVHPHLPVYKKWVVQQYNVMRLLSMERPLPLDAVYTDVYLLNKNQYWQNLDGDQTSARLEAFSRRELGVRSERYSGVEMLEKEKHLFIVGQPGAGKTTFLRWLAVRSAQDELSLNKIPILVELRRLNDGQYSLFELIVKEWLDSGFPKALATDYAEQLIRNGDALVLLDGLDEVRQELREQVNNQIDDLVKMSGDSHVLITCRPHAETRRFDRFIYMEMAEFTPEQTNQFINNWFGDEEKANKLIQELENREQKPIQELTKTPLLLALICITYEQVDELPQKRAELYKHALDIVLSKWDDERGIRRESVYGQLTTARKEELLAYVAYHSFEAKQLFILQKELEILIANYWQEWRQAEIARQKDEYGQVFPHELPELGVNAERILTEMIAQHGIFVGQAKDVYSFAHLSFQEYFTARYIASNVWQGMLERLLTHVADDQWREVFLLTTSLLDQADEFCSKFLIQLNIMARESLLVTSMLSWASEKAQNILERQSIYTYVTLCAWYLEFVDIYPTLNIALGFDLEFTLDFELAAIHDMAYFSASLGYSDDRRYLVCDEIAVKSYFAIDFDTIYSLCTQLDKVTLHKILSGLTVPETDDPQDWYIFAENFEGIIRTYHNMSGITFLQAVIQEDEIPSKMDWSRDEIDQYFVYFKATKLFVDCLPLAMVSDRVAIEDQLLLPPELNKDKKLEKE